MMRYSALFIHVRLIISLCVCLWGLPLAKGADSTSLKEQFQSPPKDSRPWVYWFWLNGNLTEEGMAADLEAMERVGIGGVLIMEVDQGSPLGPVSFMGEQWRSLFSKMVHKARQLGLEVNMNNDAGWNGSGGPWIKPEESMQKLVWTETTLEGPKTVDVALTEPQVVADYYRDICVLAFPTPGSYRIENIHQKAGFAIGGAGPAAVTELPAEMCIDRGRIIDISSHVGSNGQLHWDVPEGKWTVVRFGHTSTGMHNLPSPASGRGLECDKLSKHGIEAQFNGMMGKLISDVKSDAGSTLVATHIDSWENGSQNWTQRMREEFFLRRGYDIYPFLPVMTGYVIDSLEISERFLWDLRQTINEMVIENYADHLRTLAKPHGLHLTIEAYGSPCDHISYAGRADEPMSEFWIGGGALETCREMASAAHVYGKRILGAESFTADNRERWREHPASFKALGDRAFCDGVNRFVFHRYALQPWLSRFPGMTMGPWGIHYERTQTWWEMTPEYHKYLSRCQHLLRQGLFAADVCYLAPELPMLGFSPSGVGDIPVYCYDSCSPEVVLTRMSVQNGRIFLPDGMNYQVLVLPQCESMTPRLLGRIRELVADGATVIGSRPVRSPSLQGYPGCDAILQQMAEELWGDCDGVQVKEHPYGKGKVLSGITVDQYFAQSNTPPDFTSDSVLRHIHRVDGDTDIYFISNPKPFAVKTDCTFRVKGKVPELWWPDTGLTETATVAIEKDQGTTLHLDLDPSGSVFVVFRPGDQNPSTIVAAEKNGTPIIDFQSKAQTIKILGARYGILTDPEKTKDLTTEIQSRVNQGFRDFLVKELAQLGDPAYGEVKTLVIDYEVDGTNLSISGQDPDTVFLNEAVEPVSVDKAIYGVLDDPARTRDVKEKIQKMVDTGIRNFVVSKLAEGDDPALNVIKTLVVNYRIGSASFTATATDPEHVYLNMTPNAPQDLVFGSEEGHPFVEVWQPAEYTLRNQNGDQSSIVEGDYPQDLPIEGPWAVSFASKWGGPENVVFDKLISWTEHPENGIKYYSGVATYSNHLKISSDLFSKERRFYLDLGDVQVMAQIKVNGKDQPVLWKPPYRQDITGLLVPGENSLEIQVVNNWPNRMIGDEQLEDDCERNPDGTLKKWPEWLLADQSSPTGRFTFTSWKLWKKEDALLPSGLLGPVKVKVINRYPLP